MKKWIAVLLMCGIWACPALGQEEGSLGMEFGPMIGPEGLPSVEKAREARENKEIEQIEKTSAFKPLGVRETPDGQPTVYKYVGEDGQRPDVTSVQQAKKLELPTQVVMVGEITRHISAEMYDFSDATGTIIVRINPENWKGVSWNGFGTYPAGQVMVEGWTENGFVDGVRINVESVYPLNDRP